MQLGNPKFNSPQKIQLLNNSKLNQWEALANQIMQYIESLKSCENINVFSEIHQCAEMWKVPNLVRTSPSVDISTVNDSIWSISFNRVRFPTQCVVTINCLICGASSQAALSYFRLINFCPTIMKWPSLAQLEWWFFIDHWDNGVGMYL